MPTHHKENTFVRPEVLLGILRRMKAQPLKVWVAKDFGVPTESSARRHLITLVKLGLIEQVPILYYGGKEKRHLIEKSNCYGFRLRCLREIKLKDNLN